jgi:MoxR-like ATPase
MENKEINRSDIASLMERILYEVKKIIVGQDHFLERVLVAVLAQGHLLVEGVPGLAKTLTVKTLARTMRGSFRRIQFTPDLVPADLVGTRIYNQKSGDFATSLGPVFTNFCSRTKLTGRRRRYKARYSKLCRNARSRSPARATMFPSHFW